MTGAGHTDVERRRKVMWQGKRPKCNKMIIKIKQSCTSTRQYWFKAVWWSQNKDWPPTASKFANISQEEDQGRRRKKVETCVWSECSSMMASDGRMNARIRPREEERNNERARTRSHNRRTTNARGSFVKFVQTLNILGACGVYSGQQQTGKMVAIPSVALQSRLQILNCGSCRKKKNWNWKQLKLILWSSDSKMITLREKSLFKLASKSWLHPINEKLWAQRVLKLYNII